MKNVSARRIGNWRAASMDGQPMHSFSRAPPAQPVNDELFAASSARKKPRSALGANQLRELVEFLLIQIRHHPAIHPRDHQLLDVVSMLRLDSLGARRGACRRPHENVDHMVAMLIHERRDRPAVDIVETAAHQRKSVFREIVGRWREIKLAVEPRLDRMLIGRGNVHVILHGQRRGRSLLGHDVTRRAADSRSIERLPRLPVACGSRTVPMYAFLILAAWRVILELSRRLDRTRIAFMVVAIVAAGALLYQGKTGGELVYEHGVGASMSLH